MKSIPLLTRIIRRKSIGGDSGERVINLIMLENKKISDKYQVVWEIHNADLTASSVYRMGLCIVWGPFYCVTFLQ